MVFWIVTAEGAVRKGVLVDISERMDLTEDAYVAILSAWPGARVTIAIHGTSHADAHAEGMACTAFFFEGTWYLSSRQGDGGYTGPRLFAAADMVECLACANMILKERKAARGRGENV